MPRGIPRAKAETLETPQPVEAPALEKPSVRAEEVRRERRRRDDGDLDRMGRMALAIPPEVKERLDREGKTCRWVLDTPGRQTAMLADDWDVTPGVTSVAEARDSDVKLVLMEKYRDWYNDDQRKKTTLLDEREKAIQNADGENRKAGDGLVIPKGQSNRISRERGL